ncbi:anti-sigma B factor RsbW [Paenibacillus sp. SEL3]|uniref:Anti-sigma B factor RsbW n=1 Tax=Paenibacillus polymyxa TaxID=1406 RepID=A0A8I1ISY0_PAEPO|nr:MULTISPECIES: anti-sigma B factor RsbW [Paenibacillus]ADM71799.1 histidine kinase [Paenibacillus polymyxa E681]KAF6571281.1 anti-sigma B factor RsbW [Paenibacillus sp. EKM206P]KAF6586282.1 anti-sigma B factor RsbW [Paenibacillus sp. EKM205P]KEO77151.1 serine/threonine protein kinase [Paenibacillus polymyxa]MBM0635417.1 anti-sigma B factor RsbW [Paenibacillus polymyxa]
MNAQIQKVVLNLPATADFVDIVRLNLYGIAAKMGFSYEDIEDMKVAVSEACNNSVLYAYGHEGGVVEVTFEFDEVSLSIRVKDEGESFERVEDPSRIASLHDKELNDAQIGGLGFYLMQALMDDVHILNETGKGTEVVLVKRLTRSEERV